MQLRVRKARPRQPIRRAARCVNEEENSFAPMPALAALHVDFFELDLAELAPRLLACDPIHRGDGSQPELAYPPNDLLDAAAELLGDHVHVSSTIDKDSQDAISVRRPVHGREGLCLWTKR